MIMTNKLVVLPIEFEDDLLVGFIDHRCLSDAAPHKTQKFLRPSKVSHILAHLLSLFRNKHMYCVL